MKARLAALSGAERSSPYRLRMKHRALRSRVKELEGEVERLRSLNRQLQQATYGRRSERRCRSQRRGAAVTAPGAGRSRGQQRGAPGHGRTPRPALPVVEPVVEPPARRCAHGGRPYAANGASVTQLIEVEVSAYVRRIHRPRTRARCRCAPTSEAVAPPPARLFANTAYGVSVWAWFVLECYAHHRPLRAVARALATMGIPIAPGTLADAQSRLLGVFEPLDEAIAERQRPARLVQGDETRWMIHVRGERGDNPRCWLWVCLSADAVRMHIDAARGPRGCCSPSSARSCRPFWCATATAPIASWRASWRGGSCWRHAGCTPVAISSVPRNATPNCRRGASALRVCIRATPGAWHTSSVPSRCRRSPRPSSPRTGA